MPLPQLGGERGVGVWGSALWHQKKKPKMATVSSGIQLATYL